MKTAPLAAIALAAVVTLAPGTAAASCRAPADASVSAGHLVQSANALRARHGLPPLRFNRALAGAAQQHACDMALNGLRSHRGSRGSTVMVRARQNGYRACTIAENVAWDYPRATQVSGGWAASPGHRSNILHPRVSELGVGIAQGAKGPSWVLVLARGC